MQQAPPLAYGRTGGPTANDLSMGQAVAALSAAAGEDLTAISGSHPLTEAMLFGALALFGLIGTEHNCIHLLNFSRFAGRGRNLFLLDGGSRKIWQLLLPNVKSEAIFPAAVDNHSACIRQAVVIIHRKGRDVNKKIRIYLISSRPPDVREELSAAPPRSAQQEKSFFIYCNKSNFLLQSHQFSGIMK